MVWLLALRNRTMQAKGVDAGMSLIQVKVKPGARISQLTLLADGTYLAAVKSFPTDGKANEELIRLVSKLFGCPRSKVSIKTGRSSRLKWLSIAA